MKSFQSAQANNHDRGSSFSTWGIAIALALGLFGTTAVTTAAQAQTTTATIFGQAPAGATVTAHSDSGLHRHVIANAKGRYTIGPVPLGVYKVTLEKDGKTVQTNANIPLTGGRGAEVDFACDHDQCAAPEGG